MERKTLGYWYDGVFTKYTVVPEARVHILPDNINFTTAAMTEPLACVVHAVYDLTKIVAGDIVLVTGPGAIGIMAAQVAKAQGAIVIVAGTNIDTERLAMAKKLGADHIINIQQENISEKVANLTNNYGVDVVLECSGSAPGIDMSLNLIKKRGYYTQIGLPGKKIEFDIEKVCYKELHFSGSLGSRNHSWRKAIQLLKEGKVVLEPLASTKLSILEWEKAFKMFESKEGFKLILTPAED
ncbi:MAG: putative arabitol-phosphate dehydrogenase [Clostridiales bacterium]|nr:putative arabitol-phosphate dehydrogenase [Clostridiales bacterium]